MITEEIEKFKERVIERTLQILRDTEFDVVQDVCVDLDVDYILDHWESEDE